MTNDTRKLFLVLVLISTTGQRLPCMRGYVKGYFELRPKADLAAVLTKASRYCNKEYHE